MSKEAVNYIIISGRSYLELIGFVNAAITNGYIPLGGIAVDNTYGNYMQGMVRKELLK